MAKKNTYTIHSILSAWASSGSATITDVYGNGKKVKKSIADISHVGGGSYKVSYEGGLDWWFTLPGLIYADTNFWESIDDGMGSYYHKKWSVVHDKGPVDYIESLYRNSPLCTKSTK